MPRGDRRTPRRTARFEREGDALGPRGTAPRIQRSRRVSASAELPRKRQRLLRHEGKPRHRSRRRGTATRRRSRSSRSTSGPAALPPERPVRAAESAWRRAAASSGFFSSASATSASTSDAAEGAAGSAAKAARAESPGALAEARHHRTSANPAAARDLLRIFSSSSSLVSIESPRRKASRSRPFGRRGDSSTRDQTRRAAKRRKRGAERARGATRRAWPREGGGERGKRQIQEGRRRRREYRGGGRLK